MKLFTAAAPLREALEGLPRPLAFVPTMGALHAGHLALVTAARAECASIAASIFVNPAQFGPGEDYERYPRDRDADARLFAQAGVDVLYVPSPPEMYPPGFSTFVEPGTMGSTYEGVARPTHFRGVATVVSKLLNVIEPDWIYLGQKDAQQTAVLRRVAYDLNFPVHVRIVPTVREPDGLAMSSRNAYLDAQQRAAAPSLYRALQTMHAALQRGESVADARAQALAQLDPMAQPEYVDLVDADTFESKSALAPPAFIVGAARFGNTRLLDNLYVEK